MPASGHLVSQATGGATFESVRGGSIQ